MFRRSQRVLKEEIDKLFKTGRTAHSPFFYARYLNTRGKNLNKYTVIVSKKIAKSAVDRNRVKRQVRAALKNIGAGTGLILAITAKTNLKNISPKELTESLKDIFDKIR